MVSVSDIFLGGPEPHSNSGKKFFSGICFELSEKSRLSTIKTLSDGQFDWEIEIRENSKNIIARCEQIFIIDEIINRGNDVCQDFLDFLSISNSHYYQIITPFKFVSILYYDDSKFVLKVISEVKFSFHISVKFTDENGVELSQQIPAQTTIDEYVRYYRKSCLSHDVYEAYRNLYLSFESMLNKINPKKDQQGEGNWLIETLNLINTKINLSNHTPLGTTDPINYIFFEQYKNIRIKIFHAKKDNIIPESVSRQDVEKAYKKLLALWRDIAVHFFNLHIGGGGLTIAAFFDLMDQTFSPNFSIQITSDNTPVKPSDSMVSPMNKPVLSLKDCQYSHDSITGERVFLSGMIEKIDLINNNIVCRIGVLSNSGTLFIQEYIEKGIILGDIDILWVEFYLGFVNSNAPKGKF